MATDPHDELGAGGVTPYPPPPAAPRKKPLTRAVEGASWVGLILMAASLVFSVSTLATRPHPAAAEPTATCVPMTGLPCIPSPGEIVSGAIDPVIAQLKDATAQMLTGSFDAVAGALLTGAISGMDLLWSSLSTVGNPHLESIQGAYGSFKLFGAMIAFTAVLLGICWYGGIRHDMAMVAQVVIGAAVIGPVIAMFPGLVGSAASMSDTVGASMVFQANDLLRTWVENMSAGWIASISLATPVAPLIVGGISLVAFISILILVAILAASSMLLAMFTAFAPVFLSFGIHPRTRHLTAHYLTGIFAVLMIKPAIGAGINVVVSFLAGSTQASGMASMVILLQFGAGLLLTCLFPLAIAKMLVPHVSRATVHMSTMTKGIKAPVEIGLLAATGSASGMAGAAKATVARRASAGRSNSSGKPGSNGSGPGTRRPRPSNPNGSGPPSNGHTNGNGNGKVPPAATDETVIDPPDVMPNGRPTTRRPRTVADKQNPGAPTWNAQRLADGDTMFNEPEATSGPTRPVPGPRPANGKEKKARPNAAATRPKPEPGFNRNTGNTAPRVTPPRGSNGDHE